MKPLRCSPRNRTFPISLERYVDSHPARDLAAFVSANPVSNGEHDALWTLDEMSARVFVVATFRSDVGQQRQIEGLLECRWSFRCGFHAQSTYSRITC